MVCWSVQAVLLVQPEKDGCGQTGRQTRGCCTSTRVFACLFLTRAGMLYIVCAMFYKACDEGSGLCVFLQV